MSSTLRLQSSDGKFYDVDVSAAKQSTTIKTMLEDLDIGDESFDQIIPVPNVRSDILEKVVEWSEQHKQDPEPTEDDDFKFFETNFQDLPNWEQDFILALDQPTLFELTLAATYRARQISTGSTPLVPDERDKPTVTALREIAAGKVGLEVLNRGRA